MMNNHNKWCIKNLSTSTFWNCPLLTLIIWIEPKVCLFRILFIPIKCKPILHSFLSYSQFKTNSLTIQPFHFYTFKLITGYVKINMILKVIILKINKFILLLDYSIKRKRIQISVPYCLLFHVRLYQVWIVHDFWNNLKSHSLL